MMNTYCRNQTQFFLIKIFKKYMNNKTLLNHNKRTCYFSYSTMNSSVIKFNKLLLLSELKENSYIFLNIFVYCYKMIYV